MFDIQLRVTFREGNYKLPWKNVNERRHSFSKLNSAPKWLTELSQLLTFKMLNNDHLSKPSYRFAHSYVLF